MLFLESFQLDLFSLIRPCAESSHDEDRRDSFDLVKKHVAGLTGTLILSFNLACNVEEI